MGLLDTPGYSRAQTDAHIDARLAASPTVIAAAVARVQAEISAARIPQILVYGRGPNSAAFTTVTGTPAFAAGKFGNALASAKVITPASVITEPSGSQVVVLEGWVKSNGVPAGPTRRVFTALGDALYLSAESGTGRASVTVGSSTRFIHATSIADNAWHHVRLQVKRSAGVTVVDNLWVDGVAGNPAISPGATAWDGKLTIGGFASLTTFDWSGQTDEVRISKVARNVGNFTPDAAAFTWDDDTALLAHLEDLNYQNRTAAYPPRPPVANGLAEYIGLVQPTDWLSLDRWIQRATS